MSILSWVVVGIVVGALGKAIMPADDPGGFVGPVLIGIAGALVGEFVLGLLGGPGPPAFNASSILAATLGAIVLLALYRAGRSWLGEF